MRELRRVLHFSFILVLILGGINRAGSIAPAAAVVQVLQQFTTRDHIFGARPDGINLVSAKHSLNIDFVQAQAVNPLASGAAAAGTEPQPLEQVRWANLWPGISLDYISSQSGLAESTYHLAPGADVNAIRLRYHAATRLGADGSLKVGLADGEMSESAPVAWQEIGGARIAIGATFAIRESGEQTALVGFDLQSYDPAYPLTIDPHIRWTSSLGAENDQDVIRNVAVDSSGNSLVCGESQIAWGYPIRPFSGGQDVFIAKLDASGVLLWSTFLGAAGDDACTGIALDGSGNAYVNGFSHNSWGIPVLGMPFPVGGSAVFVARLSPAGALQWIGFVPTLDAGAIAVKGSAVYVAVATSSDWGGTPIQARSDGSDEALVFKLDAATGTLGWNTYAGGSGNDFPQAIAVDASGNVLVAGKSNATWGSSPRNAYAGDWDTFAFKLNSSGVRQWNTFLGGTARDYSSGVAADIVGNIYLTGVSYAAWGSSPIHAFNTSIDVEENIYVAKLDSAGYLVWNTFQASLGTNYARGIAVTPGGTVYISGASRYSWGPGLPVSDFAYHGYVAQFSGVSGVVSWAHFFVADPGEDTGVYGVGLTVAGDPVAVGFSLSSWGNPILPFSGKWDGFVAKLDHTASGASLWHTFLGASDDDNITSIALGASGSVYVTGISNAAWGTSHVRAYTFGYDVFVAKLDASGALVWLTFLGGSGDDYGYAIRPDGLGHLLVTGSSSKSWGSPKQAYTASISDGFLASLDPTSGALNWNTFVGGLGEDLTSAVTTDAVGNIYLAGSSTATWGPTPARAYTAQSDAFVAKYNSSGILMWNTFLGGTQADTGDRLALGSAGAIVLMGTTRGTWGAAPRRSFSGSWDCMVADLDTATGALQWNTFLGGAKNDDCKGLVVDSNGNIYVSGDSTATWGVPLHSFTGPSDGFVAKMSPSGVFHWTTFIGLGNTYRVYIALTPTNEVYLAATVIMQPSATSYNDTLIGKLDGSGKLAWHYQFGNGNYYSPNAFALDSNGMLYLAAIAKDVVSGYNGFVSKIDPSFYTYLPTLRR